ncbi:MFS transporter [Streptomyces sp. NPDC051907]|uniref:MFS transporter n=1 Tax=Streptomyces sp. NPDC051907 TaxID=3155284 RepID=UPI0034229458
MRKRYALGWYVTGAAVARTGDEMSGPALLLAGLAVTGSASSASALLAGLMVSAAVGGPVFGVLLDRSPRPGRLLTWALAAYVTALAAILLALGRLPIAVLVPVAALAGLLGPALSGGWTAQLPRVVAAGLLPRANAYDAMTFNLASLLGPALAGVVAGLAGASEGVLVSLVLICLALPMAWALPPAAGAAPGALLPAARTAPSAPPAPPPPVLADLAAGFRAIVRIRPLARATAASVIACVAEGVLVVCCPLLGERRLGEAGYGAMLLSGVAVSALAANAALARRPGLIRPDTVVWAGALVLAAALALAATGSTALLVVAVVLAGVSEGPRLTALFAIRHRESPERLRGQIFTTGASLKLTGFAVGAAVAGPLAVRSLPGALLAGAGCALLAALSPALVRSRTGGLVGRSRPE